MKNPNLVYQAKSFYNAYIALESLIPAGDELLLMVPKLVNGAFSAELTIKAILSEQGISYSHEHNLKILFDKLPLDIQERIWSFLATKVPEYSDIAKCETELLIMSEAFIQWRYFYEGKVAPSFDARFLSAFANAMIYVMFELGYNVFFTPSEIPLSSEEYTEIDQKFEDNRKECIENNLAIIQKKKRNGQR